MDKIDTPAAASCKQPARLSPIILLLVVGLLASGCGFQLGGSKRLELRTPWEDGETAVYTLQEEGETVGQAKLQVAATEEGWLLTAETTTADWAETAAVQTRATSLQPLAIDYEVRTDDEEVRFTGDYGLERVDVALTSPEGERTYSIDLPKGDHFDNEQFLHVLRALPLAPDWRGGVTLIVTRAATQAILGVWVVGEETVTTPLGSIDCWQVEIRGVGQKAWVEKAAPHRLVKYENETEGTILLLDSYTAVAEDL